MDIWFTQLALLLQVPPFSHQPIVLLCLDLLQLVTDITRGKSFTSHKPISTQVLLQWQKCSDPCRTGSMEWVFQGFRSILPLYTRLSGMDFRGKKDMKTKHCRMALLWVNVEVEVDEQVSLVLAIQEAWASQKPVELSCRASPKCECACAKQVSTTAASPFCTEACEKPHKTLPSPFRLGQDTQESLTPLYQGKTNISFSCIKASPEVWSPQQILQEYNCLDSKGFLFIFPVYLLPLMQFYWDKTHDT